MTEMKIYTKEDVIKAGEMGEINHHDTAHIVSLLDEAKQYIDKQQNGNDFIANISHRLLRELRQTYLVNVDNDGQPRASISEIMDLWDRVNQELQIGTID